ncbi:nucleotidyltransferase family protein [Microbacterium esteraromaticum]|uniref:Nucleotidyltransferase family protein n=1 Tax=Microbacterium esteraromaticum TaxID=57043 RepID=A0A7D7WHN4_9MICO|nr:nucleotidyltransferase family protein [Microbacterium esteraromaticum]QMU97413.1 nucleotidyltransferase family protein [Microbacterium esteraromaticum]
MIESAPGAPTSRPTPSVPGRARIALARAAVQVIADGIDVRLLHIKGDAVDPALRPLPRPGSDVDLLADPARIAVLHRALLAHGWRVYSTFRFGSSFEHAQTYTHAIWGYLDLHRRFPGIGLPDQEAFDQLWQDRTQRDACGIPIQTPSIDAQLLILVLNAARSRGRVPEPWSQLDGDGRRRLNSLVARLRAEVAVAALTGGLDRYRRRREHLLWRVTVQGGPRIAEWWGRILAQPTLRGRLRVTAQAPLVNTDRLTRRLGREPRPHEVVVEFFARGVRGVREGVTMLVRKTGRR